MWALGCFLALLGGEPFSLEPAPTALFKAEAPNNQREFNRKRLGNLDQILGVFTKLGTPRHDMMTRLPLFPLGVPTEKAKPWRSIVWKRLGSSGVKMLDSMVALDPALRPDAAALLEHVLFPERLRLADLKVPPPP